jgi:hypothetical protein
MKQRTKGFLSDDVISHESEQFDYIRELHSYLWKFVRLTIPNASGNLDYYINILFPETEKKKQYRLKIDYYDCGHVHKAGDIMEKTDNGKGVMVYRNLKDKGLYDIYFENVEHNPDIFEEVTDETTTEKQKLQSAWKKIQAEEGTENGK